MPSPHIGRIATCCRIVFALLLLVAGLAFSRVDAVEGPPGFNLGDAVSNAGGGDGDGGGLAGGLLGEGIDFRGGMLDWEEDEEGRRVAILRNYAVVILPQLTISARNMVLNVEMQEIYAEGDVLFDEAGGNAFYCDQLTFNYQEWKGLAKNIRVKMDREGVELPVRDFLDFTPSTSMTGSNSINDAGTGEAGIPVGQLKRMYVQAQELRAHDRNTFELVDARVTPSSFARPHWYFHSPAALYRQTEKIESYHNTVRIGRLPVLYFPYLIRDLQYDWPWMSLSGGSTGDYGFFLRSQWGWRLRDRPNAKLKVDRLVFDLDLFTNRGIGVGAETTYRVGDLESLGKLKVYGVWEGFATDGEDTDRAYDKNETRIFAGHPNFSPDFYQNKFRWAVDWEHYQQLNDLWDVRAEAHLYHDRDYLKTYDPTRYWNDKEPENSIDVRRLDKNWELEFVASSRLSNSWANQAEYYPEARLTVPGLQIGDSNLYFKNDMRVGLVNRRFDEDEYRYSQTPYQDRDGIWHYPDRGPFGFDSHYGQSRSRLYDKDNYGTMFRAFNEMRLEAPLPLWGMFTLKPWVGLRTAYYSKTLGENYNWANPEHMALYPNLPPYIQNAMDQSKPPLGLYSSDLLYRKGSDEYNIAVPFGANLTTRLYTLFGANDQWRLISEPLVGWTENSRPRLDSRYELYPVDSYDQYWRERVFSYQMHWKLQRRNFDQSSEKTVPERDVLDVNVAFHQYPRREDRHENGERRFSDVTADVIYRPIQHLSISGSVDWDPQDNTVNRAMGAVDWRINNYVRTSVSQYHYRGNYWRYPDASPSSQPHLAVRTKLWNDSSRYSLEGAVAYEWRDSNNWRSDEDGVRHGFNKYRVSLFRDMDTFEMSLSYVRDRNADDHGIFFNLTPKSFMGYESPPPGYSMEIEELADGRYSQQSRFADDGYLIDGPVRDADIKDVQF